MLSCVYGCMFIEKILLCDRGVFVFLLEDECGAMCTDSAFCVICLALTLGFFFRHKSTGNCIY